MRPRSISVMLVDDHAVVREGYRRLLEKHEGIIVVAEAADAVDLQPDRVPRRGHHARRAHDHRGPVGAA